MNERLMMEIKKKDPKMTLKREFKKIRYTIDNLYILQFVIKKGIKKKKNKISSFWIAFNNIDWKKREILKKKGRKKRLIERIKETLGNEK